MQRGGSGTRPFAFSRVRIVRPGSAPRIERPAAQLWRQAGLSRSSRDGSTWVQRPYVMRGCSDPDPGPSFLAVAVKLSAAGETGAARKARLASRGLACSARPAVTVRWSHAGAPSWLDIDVSPFARSTTRQWDRPPAMSSAEVTESAVLWGFPVPPLIIDRQRTISPWCMRRLAIRLPAQIRAAVVRSHRASISTAAVPAVREPAAAMR